MFRSGFRTARQTLNTSLNNWMGKDPSTLVAKTSPLTQQAYDTASALNPSTMFDNVPTLNASSLLENLGAYQNPYLRDVVDTTLAITTSIPAGCGRTKRRRLRRVGLPRVSLCLARGEHRG